MRMDDTPKRLEFTAHAYALAPIGPADQGYVLRLATRRASILHSPWSEHVMGLALYRAGRFAEADTCLRLSLEHDPGWDYQVLNWLVLAMADHRLGRLKEARSWSKRAEHWVEVRLRGRPGGTDWGIPENWMWRYGFLVHLLRREASALMAQRLLDLPDDVFAPPP
jgi:hypothetical protein